MQARNLCELLCLQKGWHAQFFDKEPRIVCAATHQMPSENQLRLPTHWRGSNEWASRVTVSGPDLQKRFWNSPRKCFVSGHGFSRAVQVVKGLGL